MDDGLITEAEREKLYDEVWAEPVRTVAKRYGISDVALSKRCRKLKIPLPGKGYWAKRSAGKKLPDRPKLPKVDYQLTRYVKNYFIIWKDFDQLSDDELVEPLPLHLLEPRSVATIDSFAIGLEIEKQLRNPSEWTRQVIETATKSRASEREEAGYRGQSLWSTRSANSRHVMHYPFEVKPREEKRVLRILDTLSKTLCKIEGLIRDSEPFWNNRDVERHLIIYLLEDVFNLQVNEDISGTVVFTFTSVRDNSRSLTLTDQEEHPIEKCLGQAVRTLCLIADEEYGKAILQGRVWDRECEEKERQRRIELRRQDELERYSNLTKAADDWAAAKRMREFANVLSTYNETLEDETQKDLLAESIDWIKAKADWADPLVEQVDEILGKGQSIWNILNTKEMKCD
jgi:hypothetical protein